MYFGQRYCIALLLLLIIMPVIAFCEPDVIEQTRYYNVEGDSPQSIRQSMNTQRRMFVKGGYDAYVSWFLAWRFRYDDDLKGCKINTVSTKLKVRYILPRWVGGERSSSKILIATKARWQKYYAALLEHEHGHRDWGINAATAIEQRLLAMPYARDCLSLRRDAQSLAVRVLANYLRREKHYDRDTRYGATQGAVFP